jgi:hypothetical protein
VMAHTSYVGWSGEVILEASSWKGPYKVVGSDLIDHCEYCEEGASHAYHHYVAHHHNIPRYTIMYIINACVLSLSRFLLPHHPLLRKNATPFEFSLCLSGACLGKMIVFIYKWRRHRRRCLIVACYLLTADHMNMTIICCRGRLLLLLVAIH